MSSKFKKAPFQNHMKEKFDNQNVLITILKQARKSGVLNLSNRSFAEVPESVWRLNQEVPGGEKSLSMDDMGDAWWDQVDLVKLILASNNLTEISENISNFKALTHLDLHDNKLQSLPVAISELSEVVRLNISQNSFEEAPNCIFQLKNLRCLHMQQNKIKHLPQSLGCLIYLEELDMSENQITRIPNSIESLTKLINLRISQNCLDTITSEIGFLRNLKSLDLRQNKINQLPDELGELKQLELLYLQMNSISKFPQLNNCTNLKELYLGKNCIKEMTVDNIKPLTSLVILDVRENQLKVIPEEICVLKQLERLDMTNNDLSNIPNVLGKMTNLKSLLVDGNPMRSIRRDLLTRGTVELKKYLVSRIAEVSSPHTNIPSIRSSDSGLISVNRNVIDEVTLKATKSLDLSNKKLPEDSIDLFSMAARCCVTQVNCSKNLVTFVPKGLFELKNSLMDLNMSFNKISCLDSNVGELCKLATLNLSNNLLVDLPSELSNLKSLREINISCNRMTKLPEVLYGLSKLEAIFISDNKVESFDAEKLQGMTNLSSLDLQNNNISLLDPKLGRCTQLKHCKLEGNAFRNPGFAILSKGTDAVLKFLRDKIAE